MVPGILECSSKGDKRFSAYYAQVSVFGKMASIEYHYQTSKLFFSGLSRRPAPSIEKAKEWQKGGADPEGLWVDEVAYDAEYITAWYWALWGKYLDLNPHLVQYASQFDDFNDIFGRRARNCQADVIRAYVKQGPQAVWGRDDVIQLMKMIEENKRPVHS